MSAKTSRSERSTGAGRAPRATEDAPAREAPAGTVGPQLMPSPSCVHCGFCLPACPTYAVLGTELDNPRGRLALMSALDSGRVDATPAVVRHLDACLGCRACETACPSGVPYAEHLAQARASLRTSRARPRSQRLLEAWILRAVGAAPTTQRLGAWALRLLSWSRLPRFATGKRMRRWLPSGAAQALELLRSRPLAPVSLPRVTAPIGEPRMRVGLLTGCAGHWLYGSVNAATVRLLTAAGCEVVVPPGQRCCGALHAHSGHTRGARRLASANIKAFAAAGELDAIVTNAAGCGSTMKEYEQLFAQDDPTLRDQARAFAHKTRDALELLAELGLPAPRREVRGSVAYHHACHLHHAQGIRTAPTDLLARIPGLELRPLEDAERCCGSAGIYNVLQPDVAAALLDDKLTRLKHTDADVVAAANPGCLLHIARGLKQHGCSMRAVHPIELLDQACRETDDG